jgi:hypothetical protein
MGIAWLIPTGAGWGIGKVMGTYRMMMMAWILQQNNATIKKEKC